MTPNDTVFMMIRAFPSLYRTRNDALKALFDNPNAYWENGELQFDSKSMDEFGKLRDRSFLPDHYQLKHAKKELQRLLSEPEGDSDNLSLKLGQKLQQACEALILNLAEHEKDITSFQKAKVYSRLVSSSFDSNPSNFSGVHLKDMPENVSPAWRDAATGLAKAIMSHVYISDKPFGQIVNDQDYKQFQDAQNVAKGFLEGIGGIRVNSQERINRIRNELNDLGLNGVSEYLQSIVTGQGTEQENDRDR